RFAHDPAVIGALVNPSYPDHDVQLRELQEGGAAIGQKIDVVRAATAPEIDTAFALLVQQGAGALIVANDPFFVSRRDQIVAIAARAGVWSRAAPNNFAAMLSRRDSPRAGGLLIYGERLTAAPRQGGIYTEKTPKGPNPADLPVMQPTRFELVINLKTAKALGLT